MGWEIAATQVDSPALTCHLSAVATVGDGRDLSDVNQDGKISL
jgi:hypothetical protein